MLIVGRNVRQAKLRMTLDRDLLSVAKCAFYCWYV